MVLCKIAKPNIYTLYVIVFEHWPLCVLQCNALARRKQNEAHFNASLKKVITFFEWYYKDTRVSFLTL